MSEPKTAHVVIAVIDACMYVLLREAEKHVLYREIIGTSECITLYPRCRRVRGRYNGVKLYRVTIKEIDTFNVVLKRNY
jgi:hypothetical protein